MTTNSAPRLRVHTVDGTYVELANLSAAEVMAVVDGLDAGQDGAPMFSFDMDNGRSQVHIPRPAILRVDVDWEVGWLARTRARIRATWDSWR